MTPDRPLIFTSRTSDPGQPPLNFLSFILYPLSFLLRVAILVKIKPLVEIMLIYNGASEQALRTKHKIKSFADCGFACVITTDKQRVG
jgi:hypothetical protein